MIQAISMQTYMSPLIFDLMNLIESTQFIGSARCKWVISCVQNPSNSSMIMGSQAIFAYIMSRMTFDLDLMTPKSNQFISSASNITWSKFGRNPSIGSWDNAITSCFCIHNEPCDLWPLTSWPQNLISLSALQDTYTWSKFGRNPSIGYSDNAITRTGRTYGRTTRTSLIKSCKQLTLRNCF